MAKKNIANKIIGAGAGLALSALPLVSNAQDYNQIQKGVNASTYVTETPTHAVFHSNFNKDLQKAIKSSKNPSIYLTGDKNSYVIVDPDTSGFKIYYSKNNFDNFGNGKKVVCITVKGDEHMNPCDINGLGSKTNNLASYCWMPSLDFPEKPQKSTSTTKEVQKEQQPSTAYNITNINNTTNTTNNYYADTTNKKVKKSEGEGLELRLLVDGNKTVNPIESPFLGASAAIQLGKGAVWLGPYATVGFGSEISSSSTPIYHETLLNQTLQLFTITEGIRNESASLAYPIEFGGLLSVGSKDGRVRVNAGYGIVKEATSTSGVNETGHDWMAQNGEVVGEKKPYAINLKEGTNSSEYIPTQKVGIDVHPFKNSGFYLGAEAQHRGKVNSKIDKINYNVKAGWRFGGKKK
jgi:hypothetical protein